MSPINLDFTGDEHPDSTPDGRKVELRSAAQNRNQSLADQLLEKTGDTLIHFGRRLKKVSKPPSPGDHHDPYGMT
jgi:hypothetical protein